MSLNGSFKILCITKQGSWDKNFNGKNTSHLRFLQKTIHTWCTLRSLLNELACLIPKLGVKRASSFNRDLRVCKPQKKNGNFLCVTPEIHISIYPFRNCMDLKTFLGYKSVLRIKAVWTGVLVCKLTKDKKDASTLTDLLLPTKVYVVSLNFWPTLQNL